MLSASNKNLGINRSAIILMMKSFIDNYSTFLNQSERYLLREVSNVKDLFKFDEEIQKLKRVIDGADNRTLLAIVGGYGSGKSTLIHQYKETKLAEGDSKWIRFDSWKYPDKYSLWEGFVIDFARSIGLELEEIINRIEGKKQNLINFISKILPASVPDPILKSIAGILVSLFGDQSPATRTVQLQSLLSKLIASLDCKNIFIEIEDIDRSDDGGIHFLETLNYFLLSEEFETQLAEKRIQVLVPVSSEFIDVKVKVKSNEKNNTIHYGNSLKIEFEKIFSEIFYFYPRRVDSDLYVSEIMNNSVVEVTDDERSQCTGALIDFINDFQEEYPFITIRTIKKFFQRGENIWKNINQECISPMKGFTIAVALAFLESKFDLEEGRVEILKNEEEEFFVIENTKYFTNLVINIIAPKNKFEISGVAFGVKDASWKDGYCLISHGKAYIGIDISMLSTISNPQHKRNEVYLSWV